MNGRIRVGFTGYYGMCNFGDDLFGVLCSASARRYWNADPLLIGPALHGAEARATWPASLPSRWYGATGTVGKAARLLGFTRGLRESDVLVMGGGSVITARESFRKPMMLSARRRGRVQLAAVGVSVGPFPDPAAEASAAEFVRQFSYLSVRDRRSYELALRMGLEPILHEGRDLAGLLNTLVPLHEPPRSRMNLRAWRVGLAPCQYSVRDDHPAPTPEQWHEAAVEGLKRIAAHVPVQVAVFSLNGHAHHGDEALAVDLQHRLRDAGLQAEVRRYRGDPIATVHAIRGCDAFISARLHGAIVSYLCGVPFAMVDYHPKCRDFADDIGLPEVLRINGAAHDATAFTRVLEMFMNESGAHARLSPDVYALEAQDIFQCAPWSTSHRSASQAA